MNATGAFRFVGFLAGNQTGKSLSGCILDFMHATGLYNLFPWYKGRKFSGPTVIWAASTTADFTRDNIQRHLVGYFNEKDEPAGGIIPRELILNWTRRSRPANAIDQIWVKHFNEQGEQDGVSLIQFKDYSQGYRKFAGGTVHVIHLDEDPVDGRITTECKARFVQTRGIMYYTLTPTEGLTASVKEFWPEPSTPFHYTVQMTLDDCARLSETEKREIIAAYPEHERECRVKGVPFQGAGAIIPFSEAVYVTRSFPLPPTMRYGIGIDFGWSGTAAVGCAYDAQTDTIYAQWEYLQSEQILAINAARIKELYMRYWGYDSNPIVFWPHDGEIPQDDGATLAQQWASQGLRMHSSFSHYLVPRDDGKTTRSIDVSSGIEDMISRMQNGRLKIFEECRQLRMQLQFYHRRLDSVSGRSEIVKKDDHLIDALRQFIMMCRHAELLPDQVYFHAPVAPVIAKHDYNVLEYESARRPSWSIG